MQTKVRRKKLQKKWKAMGLPTQSLPNKIFTGTVPVFTVAFMAAFFASSVFTPVQTSDAATLAQATVTANGYTIDLQTPELIDMSLSATPSGAMTVAKTTITTETNSPYGYKLYLGMDDGITSNSLFIRDGNGTPTGGEIRSTGTITTAAALENGYWGYAFNNGADDVVTNNFDASYTAFESGTPVESKFAAIPVGTPQLIRQTHASNQGNPQALDVYFGLRADFSQPSGVYTNQIAFTAVADASPSGEDASVSPNSTEDILNTGDITVTTSFYGTMASANYAAYMLTTDQYNAIEAGTATIESLGVTAMTCTKTDASYFEITCERPAIESSESGVHYVYVDIPDYDKHYTATFTYVATLWNIATMQEMTSTICNNATTPKSLSDITASRNWLATMAANPSNYTDTGNGHGSAAHAGNTDYIPQATLKDARDGNEYIVRKLADGKCWMTNNLRLEFDGSTALTSTLSNVTTTVTPSATQVLSNGLNNSGATDADKTLIQDWHTDPTTGNVATTEQQASGQVDGYRNIYNQWLSRSTKNVTEDDANIAAAQKTGENQKLGTYYNWYTATAGTGTSSYTAGQVAPADICPKGWQLPRYTGTGSWMTLIRDTYHVIVNQGDQSSVPSGNTGANATLHKFPFSLPYSGNVDYLSGATINQGSYGYFWSSGATNAVKSRYLDFDGTYVWPEGNNYRSYGFSVRCVSQ